MPASNHRVARRISRFKGEVLLAAAELFAAQGVEATTVDDICAKAEVSRRTLANHFPTKSDLVRALAKASEVGMARRVQAGAKPTDGLPERIALVFDLTLETLKEAGPVHADWIASILQTFHEVSAEGHDGTRLLGAIRTLLEERADDLPAGCNVEKLAHIILGSLYTVLLQSAHREYYDLPAHLEEMSDTLVRLFQGSSPPRTRQPGAGQ